MADETGEQSRLSGTIRESADNSGRDLHDRSAIPYDLGSSATFYSVAAWQGVGAQKPLILHAVVR